MFRQNNDFSLCKRNFCDFSVFEFIKTWPAKKCPYMLIEVIDGRIMNHFWHILELDNQLLQSEEGVEIFPNYGSMA